MNRFASNGPIAVVLAEKEGQAVYQAWLKDDVVAEVHLTDWENPEVDFYSKEAAQILADSYKEIFASSIEVEADIDTEGDMIKHPDGTTTDVPEGAEKGHPDESKSEKPEENETSKTIIIHLNDLLQKAEIAHKNGNLELEAAFLDEAENFAARIASIKEDLAKKAANELLAQAEELLAEGIDCTAQIDEAETLMRHFVQGGISATVNQPMKKQANPSFWTKLSKVLFNYG